MAANPFTAESRDEIVSLHLDGCQKLRMPSSLRRLLHVAKPAHLSTADFLLKGCLDAYLMTLISAGKYPECQATIAALFGPAEYRLNSWGTVVPKGNGADA